MSELKYNFTDKELKLLNSNKAIKLLLKDKNNINPEKVLRYVKYEKRLEEFQVELIKLQQWAINEGKRICLLFEGRDSAGKGGAIRRVTHHLNPRNYRVVALPKPTEEERGQWYFQRYISRLPNPGEIVFFDRSWYNRAVVEPVNGFCTNEEYERFMREVNNFETMLTNDGIILLKFYFSITKKEQAARFKAILENPLKRWKMSPVDEMAQELWDSYTEYRVRMFAETNTKNNPWIVLKANKKTSARIQVIRHILEKVPYK
ncbi:polyphosphate kinase 2 [Roseivirga ehrenbergii]|uniref:ADP/GDP-polyphosphate phosphotransferase n=3 Tax=Roseivirga TaxID=290180 RepID=A0A0L8AQ91_9BACT|nr:MULTISPECIES: polyphosphate kinase 2 [Roseivirga]KOF04352.1 polyphosphate kinase [Roseivirga seohaensis subsp. aquiponti]KYG75011.1 polyphosphate kinase [Roseivirga ehrenbergii]KYG80461.1 polyphosphate kinase [Roseivirga seohaensis]TCL13637.1 polyphosphate kinase 2 [Roseivirga ehrenbergii]|tara:strand:- start:1525 stop:2307 length:783 start_codon:yes stop_codon:yes gene_type:complete